jgi:hypothetical protein
MIHVVKIKWNHLAYIMINAKNIKPKVLILEHTLKKMTIMLFIDEEITEEQIII